MIVRWLFEGYFLYSILCGVITVTDAFIHLYYKKKKHSSLVMTVYAIDMLYMLVLMCIGFLYFFYTLLEFKGIWKGALAIGISFLDVYIWYIPYCIVEYFYIDFGKEDYNEKCEEDGDNDTSEHS